MVIKVGKTSTGEIRIEEPHQRKRLMAGLRIIRGVGARSGEAKKRACRHESSVLFGRADRDDHGQPIGSRRRQLRRCQPRARARIPS